MIKIIFKRLILLPIILILIGCSFNKKYFTNYKNLSKGSESVLKKISLDSIIEKKKIQLNNSNLDSIYINYAILNKEINLVHYFPDYEYRLTTFDRNIDTLTLFEKKFCIQDLLKQKENESIFPKIVGVFLFNEREVEKKYIIIEGIYEHEVAIKHLNWRLIFDISNKNNPIIIKSDYQNFITSNLESIEDYNCDGKIDIVFFNENEINVFNIEDYKLKKIKDINLSVKKEKNSNNYRINLKKSKWFFPLKLEQGKKSFDIIYKTPFY